MLFSGFRPNNIIFEHNKQFFEYEAKLKKASEPIDVYYEWIDFRDNEREKEYENKIKAEDNEEEENYDGNENDNDNENENDEDNEDENYNDKMNL
mgnify:CR=1 FL=1